MPFARAILKILTLRCEESARIVSAMQDGRPGLADRIAVRLHLMICGPCRRFRRHLDTVRALLRDAERHAADATTGAGDLPESMRRRLQRLVDSPIPPESP